MGELYKEDLSQEKRKQRFFDMYPELIEGFSKLTKGMDLIQGEAIVSELIDRIYEEGLKTRRDQLLKNIEAIEKSGERDEQSPETLNQRLHELNEINTRLHDMEKGDSV